MAEEKITNEEVLEDADLEEVAGGTRKEIRKDIEMLRHYGYLNDVKHPSDRQINDAILAVGHKAGIHIGYNPDDDRKNKYYIDHKTKDQEYFWNKVRKNLGY